MKVGIYMNEESILFYTNVILKIYNMLNRKYINYNFFIPHQQTTLLAK